MKAYALVLLSLVLLFTVSCDGPTGSTCKNFPNWDTEISSAQAAKMQARWQEKWDYPDSSPYHKVAETIPDSFFINFLALEEFTIGHCGFRIYNGLTRPGDISSMGLIITAINDHFGDILGDPGPQIFFTNATKPDQIKPDSLDIYNKFIGLQKAQEYTKNWRCYNGVTRDNDTLENFPCDGNRQIPPSGNLDKNITQKIPLGNAFGPSESVFLKLIGGEEDHGFEAYVIYNSFTAKNQTWTQDFFIRGYLKKDKNGPFEIGEIAIDITGHCPPFCNDQNALQGNGSNSTIN